MRRNGKSNKLIWVLAVLVLLTVLSAAGVKSAFPETLALEQSARCGLAEHVHGEECYVGDILVCREKMHTHGQNCYLVLLEDNDINELLARVDATEDNSLETLISFTVLRAATVAQLNANKDYEGPVGTVSPSPSMSPTVTPSLIPTISPSVSPSLSPSADPESTPMASPSQSVVTNQPLSVTQAAQPITNEQIAALNEATDSSQNGVVLNEYLITPGLTGDAGEGELLDALLSGGTGSGEASALAVGDRPSTGTRAINFYIRLDGTAVLINSGTLTYNNSRNEQDRKEYYSYTDTVNAYADIVVTDLRTNNIGSTYYFRYNTNGSTTFNNTAAYSNSNVYFANSNNAQYAILATRSGDRGNYTYTPVNFYTVTLNYTDSNVAAANETKYVQENYTYTLPTLADGYYWEANGQEVTSLSNLTQATTVYARPRTRTVTFNWNYDGASEPYERYDNITPGSTVAAPADPKRDENYTFGGWYTDAACTNVYNFNTPVTQNLTLYAKWIGVDRTVTLTYIEPDGTEKTEQVIIPHGDTITLDEAYDWVDKNGNEVTGTTITVESDREFIGTKKTWTVTYYDENGSVLKSHTYEHNDTHTVNYPLPAGYGYTAWVDRADSKSYDPADAETIVVKRNYGFDPVSTYTVTYIDKDGNQTTETVDPGGTATLPALNSGYVWVLDGDTSGSTYAGGTTYAPVNGNLTFRAVKSLTISYNVGSTGGASGTNPTIAGTSSKTATQIVTEGNTASLYSVMPRVILAEENIVAANGFDRISYFVGWETEDGTVLLPNAAYSEAELAGYDEDGDNIVELTGKWESLIKYSANFCIRYDITTISGGTDSGKYTKSLFTTHASEYSNAEDGTTYYGSDSSATDNAAALESDATIRALEGEKADGSFWLYEIPSDEYIFEQLKLDSGVQNGSLIIDDLSVSVDELNSDTFAIRWYVVKYYDNDGWHIDGKLVRKVGKITVTKTFDGRADYVELAQDGFTITARAGSLDDNGEFVDNSSDADVTLKLTAAAGTDTATSIGYDSRVETTSASGSTQVTYTWTIPDVGAGEVWNVKENLVTVESAVGFGEWVIVDSSNAQSDSGIGTETSVIGVTFPKDISSDEWLRVDFTNVYYTQNSILLRKVDGLSGAKLEGAQFEMWQRDTGSGEETKMTFDLVTTEDGDGSVLYRTYIYAPDGSGAYTTITCDGTEIQISVEDFSYESGPIIIREVTAPTGYILEDNEVVVGYTGETDDTGTKVVGILNSDVSSGYADFSSGLLTIKNFAPTVDITAQKAWRNCTTDEWADYVIIQLLADGSASKAASVLPDGVSTIQTLRKQSLSDGTWGYTAYTWGDLPVYVNGEKVTWSVKELQIGDEEIKSDGTFPNWLSFVSLAQYSEDETAATVTVTNNPKAGTELRIVKMDTDKTVQLPGATFTIEDENGNILGTETTDESGELIFHRLKYDVVYTIREITFPTGYRGSSDPIRITISENGTVTILENNGYAEPGASAFSLRVLNQSTAVLLPNTGGHGTIGYYAAGVAFMLLALSVAILPKLRRGRYQMRD